jgi:uncharacterized phage protein gp47/JayE
MDYIAWAKSAHPSVTSALVQPYLVGVGTVGIRPICNDLPNRQPTTEIINAIAAHLQTFAPATADWRLTAPLLHPVTVSIHLSASVDTTANRLAINAFLSSLIMTKVTNNAELWLTEIDTAILSVTSLYTRNAPMENITAEAGAVFVLNPVVFT